MPESDPNPRELGDQQAAQERAAREAAAAADTEEEARADERRADKAHYLREKLQEQTDADREAGLDEA